MVASETYRTRAHREFEALKQDFFPYDPDEPLVLVRNQIVGKRVLFQVLRDPEVAAHWEARIIQFFDAHISQIITVVLDKDTYLQSYPIPDLPPYSYCISALTERYGQWLNEVGGTGDVMTESRGRREDRQLKQDFRRFMTGGTNLPDVQEALRSVTSSQIKLNLKTDNITGLQLADLLAYPLKRGILLDNGLLVDNPPSPATIRFIEAARPKSHHLNTLLP